MTTIIIISLFIHHQVCPNLYDFLSTEEIKKEKKKKEEKLTAKKFGKKCKSFGLLLVLIVMFLEK